MLCTHGGAQYLHSELVNVCTIRVCTGVGCVHVYVRVCTGVGCVHVRVCTSVGCGCSLVWGVYSRVCVCKSQGMNMIQFTCSVYTAMLYR